MKQSVTALAILVPLLALVLAVSIVCLVEIQALGIKPTPPPPAAALNSSSNTPPSRVDVVYTWVDSGDAAWREQRNALTKRSIRAQLKTHAHRWPTLTDELSELAISIKTVRKFMPWVHTIWVVTQRPQKIEDPSLAFVHHDQILDPANLPTFNSQAIETGIYKIDGLAEHFIYMNDDFFVGKPIAPQDLFVGGKPVMRGASKVHNWGQNHPLWGLFGKNAIGEGPAVRQMRKHMGRKVYATNHQLAPMTRSLMRETEQKYQAAWDVTQGSAFRDTSNIAPVTMAYNHGLATGGVHVFAKRDDALTRKSVKMRNFSRIEQTNPAMFCIHDITTASQLERLNDYVEDLIND